MFEILFWVSILFSLLRKFILSLDRKLCYLARILVRWNFLYKGYFPPAYSCFLSSLRNNLYTFLYLVVLRILLLPSLSPFVLSIGQTSWNLSLYMPARQTLVSHKSPSAPSSVPLLDLLNSFLLQFLNRNYLARNPRILHHAAHTENSHKTRPRHYW